MKYLKVIISSLLFASILAANNVFCDMVVVVHPSNASTISKDDIERLFLAKEKSFSDGGIAIPLNHKDTSDARQKFDEVVIGKSPSQMKSYWAKLVFTGKATPIKQVESDDEVLELVSVNPSTIGYIDASKVNDKVKVVYKF